MLLTMMRGKVFLTIAGLVLGAAGLALFNFGKGPVNTSASHSSTSPSWHTSWSATKVYQVMATDDRGGRPVISGGAIGVSEWSVSGDIVSSSGTTRFTETWVGPDATTVKLGETEALGDSHCTTSSYNRDNWVLGCITYNAGPFSFSLRSVPPSTVFYDDYQGIGQGYRYEYMQGGGIGCDNPVDGASTFDGCMVTTGTYGFSYVPVGSGGGSNDTMYFSGLAMPLKWTVAGTIL